MNSVLNALIALSLTMLAATSVFADSGVSGKNGQIGSEGTGGKNGTIVGIEEWYARYPLCSIAGLIIAVHDQEKLNEYIQAGCSVGAKAPKAHASMFVYTLTRQDPRLLSLIIENARTRSEIDPLTLVPNVDVIEKLPVQLNAFELTIYYQLLGRNNAEKFPTSDFSELNIRGTQLEMLRLLLLVVSDPSKLKHATSEALQRLKNSNNKSYANVQTAIEMIESRIAELTK